MKLLEFIGTVLSGHKQAAVEMPVDPARQWGAKTVQILPGRRGYAVRGELAGRPFESHVVARSKRFWLLVEPEQLNASGVSIGDTVTVSLQPSIG